MKSIPNRSFEVAVAGGQKTVLTTADLLALVAAWHDGRGISSDDQLLLSDVRLRGRQAQGQERIALENAEFERLNEKLKIMTWPTLQGEDVARFIRDMRAPQDDDAARGPI